MLMTLTFNFLHIDDLIRQDVEIVEASVFTPHDNLLTSFTELGRQDGVIVHYYILDFRIDLSIHLKPQNCC